MTEGQTTSPAPGDLDETIRRAGERSRRLERLTRQRGELEQQLAVVRDRLAGAERQFAKEHQDVVKLERNAFKLSAGKLQQLDRERWEAAAVHQQMEGERARMNQLLADRQRMDAELAELAGAGQELERALRAKQEQLQQSGDPRAKELAEVTQRMTNVDIALREHVEALNAARSAAGPLTALRRQFGGAETWSTVDMFVGSGWAKHDLLQSADQLGWHAQRELDLLARELSDLGIQAAPMLPRVESNLFADVLFDNIISDAVKHNKIKSAIAQVDGVGHWLQQTLQWLDGRCAEIDRELRDLRGRREHLLTG